MSRNTCFRRANRPDYHDEDDDDFDFDSDYDYNPESDSESESESESESDSEYDSDSEPNTRNGRRNPRSQIRRRKDGGIDVSHIGLYGPPSDLYPMIRENDRKYPCDCYTCEPASQNCDDRRFHLRISLKKFKKNDFGLDAIQRPTLEPLRHTSKNLTKAYIAYFDKPEQELNDRQLKAIRNIRKLYKSWSARLDHPDGRKFPEEKAQQLCEAFNDLFFFGAIPRVSFAWKRLPNAHGQCVPHRQHKKVTIEVCPKTYNEEPWRHRSRPRKMSRISTFLHESLHGFVETFVCPGCRTDCGPHGRTWQFIARKLEECAPRLLGIEVNLNRFKALVSDVESQGIIPSMCDMRQFGMA